MPRRIEPFTQGQSTYSAIERPKSRKNGYADVLTAVSIHLEPVDGVQFRGDCPFCNKERHLYVSSQTGQWDCKRCSMVGNAFTFVREFYEQVCTEDDGRLSKLSEMRGIGVDYLLNIGIRWNPIAAEYVIPTYAGNGEVNNLYQWRNLPGESKRKLIGLPIFNRGCVGFSYLNQCLKDKALLEDPEFKIWIVEGPWDASALEQIIAESKGDEIAAKSVILGFTGVNGFRDDILSALQDRKVRVLFDNDSAGRNAVDVLAHKLAVARIAPREMLSMNWPEGLKEGFDINDALKEHGGKGAMKLLAAGLKKLPIKTNEKGEAPGYDPNVSSVRCESVEELMEHIKGKLEVNRAIDQSFKFLLAVAHSLTLGDGMLWSWVVGPAGSGKTTFVDLIGGVWGKTYCVDKFTGFFSGFKQGNKDASILPQCDKRIFIVRDFTGTLAIGSDADRIFGEMRDVYEGKARAAYRNNIDREYKVYFPFIGCVTNVIRSVNNADLGERFLMCEFDREWIGTSTHIHDSSSRAMDHISVSLSQNIIDKPAEPGSANSDLKSYVWGFLDYLSEYWTCEKRADALHESGLMQSNYIRSLAIMAAMARSVVDRHRDGTPVYRPRGETPTRLYRQLLKTAMSAYLVIRPSNTAEETIKQVNTIIFKIAMDTAFSWQLEIVLAIGTSSKTAQELCDHIGISRTRVQDHIQDLRDLGIVEEIKLANSGRRGPKELSFKLTPAYGECFTSILKGIS